MISRLRQPIQGYLLTGVLLALCTGGIALIRWGADVGNISTVYLIVVLAAAIAFGRGPAVLASLAAFLLYDFFFVQPQYTLTVTNEDEWIALVLLLVTGITTAQLAAALRNRAREAERREREAAILYDVVRLMEEPELQRALTAVAERLRNELDLAVVMISFGRQETTRAQADTGDAESVALARDALGLPDMFLMPGTPPTGSTRGTTGRWVKVVPPTRRLRGGERVRRVPIVLHGDQVGAVILVARAGTSSFAREEDRLLSVVANQLGLTLERLQLQREANEAEILRRTDELRTALMNAVSHDLRTPLSSIIASAGSLRQTDVKWTEEDRVEFASAIEHEAERLNRLVSNLLDLSRIEAGSLRPERGWYDIRALIHEVVGRLRPFAGGHRLNVDLPTELPPLHFDYVEIDQVVTNLVENALKYTPRGTEISVSAHLKDQVTEVEICDTGPGMSTEALPHLFDAFYRAPGRDAKVSGSGLGLAVAKGLIEAHGGSIHAENRPGGGARFVFTLPVEKDLPRPEEMRR